ncbi:hypothetical protein C823_007467 [Eubacterium plexicaudatum ASF492]|nr:hypothetical protein C823_007467 [Eubacterium plexicaudatum ASF492]
MLGTLLQSDLNWLEQHYPGQYAVETNRDDYDYVYTTENCLHCPEEAAWQAQPYCAL